MPEENRVFDVAKPGSSGPQATSKPVIVGHHPVMNDPMVRGESAEPTKIAVQDGGSEPAQPTVTPTDSLSGDMSVSDSGIPVYTPTPQPEGAAAEHPSSDPVVGGLSGSSDETPPPSEESDIAPDSQAGIVAPSTSGHLDGIHVGARKNHAKPIIWTIIVLLALLVAAYLLIDSGTIKTNINLPFHVFKQKTTPAPAVSTPPPVASNQPTTPSVPAGFTEYKLSGTTITFAAPTGWGSPTSTTEQGYSVRGGDNKADGTYAYLVDFATNKDVEIAVTSSKFLPPARADKYYDGLQWCTGTNDGKIYVSKLNYSTDNKVDTPTTITCDQGPLTDATKLNTTTIVQLGTKDASGKTIGDLYT
ncbi:MAG TPA: hypothetical protein VHD84_02125 [Candidatus Saccharimonadales bacterium]|nr:hypothetical protein [Candidatus Saccharimonadales bacterium]